MSEKSFQSFFLNKNQFCVEQSQVSDTISPPEAHPLPGQEDDFFSFFLFNDEIGLQIDLGRWLEIDSSPSPDEKQVILVRHHERLFGFLVDRIGDKFSSSDEQRKILTFHSELFHEAIITEKKLQLYIDFKGLIDSSPQFASQSLPSPPPATYRRFKLSQHNFVIDNSIIENIIAAPNLQPLPLTPGYLPGFFIFQNESVILFDPAERLSLPEEPEPDCKQILLIRYNSKLFGFIVTGVSEVLPGDGVTTRALPANIDLIKNAFISQNEILLHLDLLEWLKSEKLLLESAPNSATTDKTFYKLECGELSLPLAAEQLVTTLENPVITRIPFLPPGENGVVGYEGKPLALLNLAEKLGNDTSSANSKVVAITRIEQNLIAILADRLSEESFAVRQSYQLNWLIAPNLFEDVIEFNDGMLLARINFGTLFNLNYQSPSRRSRKVKSAPATSNGASEIQESKQAPDAESESDQAAEPITAALDDSTQVNAALNSSSFNLAEEEKTHQELETSLENDFTSRESSEIKSDEFNAIYQHFYRARQSEQEYDKHSSLRFWFLTLLVLALFFIMAFITYNHAPAFFEKLSSVFQKLLE